MNFTYIRPNNTVDDFLPNEQVRYVPQHTKGDLRHPDIENGVVSSKNDRFVFVKYIKNNILQSTAAATDPKDLINSSFEIIQ